MTYGGKMVMYETRDSGDRTSFVSGMQREPSVNKPRFDLLIPENQPYEETMLYRWAMLMARGAEKYDPRNWEKADSLEELSRAKESAFRHMIQYLCGDKEEDHASAIFFNITLAEYIAGRLK